MEIGDLYLVRAPHWQNWPDSWVLIQEVSAVDSYQLEPVGHGITWHHGKHCNATLYPEADKTLVGKNWRWRVPKA